jgi:hypothetical protein
MPTYRLIEKSAGTGERITSLSHLGFRVWMQYQLSADDFGVCPAEAVKLQGENLALQREPVKRVQAEIDRLVTIGLCGTFVDGSRRYIFQFDWQDYQKIKHPSKTALPMIPAELLAQCSPNTQALFGDHSDKRNGSFRLHGNANANATALASATADAQFERFWGPYPRKVGKGAAMVEWRRIGPDDALTDQMVAAIEAQKKSSQWRKNDGEYIPHPRTWLHQKRWLDAPDHHRGSTGLGGLEEAIRG